jgi:hypothetical protein
MPLTHQKAQTPFGQRVVDRMAFGACQTPGDYCQASFHFYCDPAIWQQPVAKLRDMNKPMGVSEYTLVEALPDNLKGALPTVEEIES